MLSIIVVYEDWKRGEIEHKLAKEVEGVLRR